MNEAYIPKVYLEFSKMGQGENPQFFQKGKQTNKKQEQFLYK